MKEDALVQFKLMLPAALKRRVEAFANSNRRSLSQEIVATLEEKYPDLTPSNDKERVELLVSMLMAAIADPKNSESLKQSHFRAASAVLDTLLSRMSESDVWDAVKIYALPSEVHELLSDKLDSRKSKVRAKD